MKFADYQFWLDGIPPDQKISRRASLEQAEKSLGRKPRELKNAPPIPEGCEYLWHLFIDMKNAGPVTYSEMVAYREMTGVHLSPFEVDCMRRLDESWKRANR